LGEVPDGPYDYLITMGCGDSCPAIPAYRRDDWNLPDPRDLPPEEYNQVRDEIERRVRALMAEVGAD
jgi:protein-tyrosine-phosphatase